MKNNSSVKMAKYVKRISKNYTNFLKFSLRFWGKSGKNKTLYKNLLIYFIALPKL